MCTYFEMIFEIPLPVFLFFNAFWFCWKSLLEYSESWVIHLNIDQITGTNAFDICLLDI